MAKRIPGSTVRAAVVGYGPWCNMGKLHTTYIDGNPRIELKAVCDIDPARTAAAEADWPAIDTTTSLAALLRRDDIDLVTCVVPHNVHCKVVLQCLRAGKHVVVEKPMAITVAECTRMIDQAEKSGVMLSVFHNRRLDGDYLAIQQVIADGLVGDVFHIEAFHGNYGLPACPWRSVKKTCGGPVYDWGAHFVDWVLGLVPSKIINVTGFLHKVAWPKVDIEDEGQAIIRFANGTVGDIINSRIAFLGKPRWLIRGNQGAITDGPNNTLKVKTLVKGRQAEIAVPFQDSRWPDYYANIADHLLRGKPLLVPPTEARRAIAVIEALERSARSHKPATVPGG